MSHKPRLLFVDDEPSVLDALSDLLHHKRREWALSFASSAREARRQMQSEPFDVVISDLRMPERSGAELLAEVKLEQPDTARVLLSGSAERELLLSALPDAHALLSKPCDPEPLRRLLERLAQIASERGGAREEWRRALALSCLPSEPERYAAFREAAEAGRLEEASREASADLALAAQLVRLAGCFHAGDARTVRGATCALGPDLIGALAKDRRLFCPAPAEIAAGVREIASAAEDDTAERLGKLGALVTGAQRPEIFGRYLCELWGLPRSSMEGR